MLSFTTTNCDTCMLLIYLNRMLVLVQLRFGIWKFKWVREWKFFPLWIFKSQKRQAHNLSWFDQLQKVNFEPILHFDLCDQIRVSVHMTLEKYLQDISFHHFTNVVCTIILHNSRRLNYKRFKSYRNYHFFI